MRREKNRRIIWVLLICICIINSYVLSCENVYAVEINGEKQGVKTLDESSEENVPQVNETDNDDIDEIEKETKEEAVYSSNIDKSVQEETENKDNQKEEKGDGDAKADKLEETVIHVKEIDLGDYQEEMYVGERQLLVATLIPEESINQDVEYRSSNESVATINGLGRISAIAVGTAEIYASCDGISNSFKLTVKEKKDEKVAVTDIEISEHEDELALGKTMTLSAKILPADATEQTIKYRSENNEIATVNSSGEVKGIKKGEVAIFVSAGDVTKTVKLKIVVGTKKIAVNSDYIVLKPGNSSKIDAHVLPEESPQELKYKSLDTSVVEVAPDGTVTAKKIGNTCIVVTNDDLSISVTVIVNNSGRKKSSGNSEDSDELVGEQEINIQYSGFINPVECSIVSKEMLKYLYENKKSTTIMGDGYTIRVDGDKIVNYANELSTKLGLIQKKNGDIEFTVNNGENLCGEITLSIDLEKNEGIESKKLYLFNASKNKYEQIQYESLDNISITKAGKYLFSEEKKLYIRDYRLAIIIGIGALMILLGGYIIVRRSYWFW